MNASRATGKVVVALVSMLVFGGTYLGWSQLHGLAGGLSTADVTASTSRAGK